jgi:hypothetical protein
MGRLLVCLIFLKVLREAKSIVSTIRAGFLGDSSLELKPARPVGGTGRRLFLEKRPESPFTVEDCASIPNLSSGKRAALAENSITKCINVYRVLIAGHSGSSACGAENNMLFMANLLAEMLDVDMEGTPTDPKVVQPLQNFGNISAAPFLLAGCSEEEEHKQANSSILGYSYSSQAWKAAAINPYYIPHLLLEEIFHMVHQHAWAKVYAPFADTWSSDLGKCVEAAQCEWYLHPENVGCTSQGGQRCGASLVPVRHGNTGKCECLPSNDPCREGNLCLEDSTCSCAQFDVDFKEPGRCYEVPARVSCAGEACELPEFLHKALLAYIGESRIYFWPFMEQEGATVQGAKDWITGKMESSAACGNLLQDFSDPTYALPRQPFTGLYKPKVANSTIVPSFRSPAFDGGVDTTDLNWTEFETNATVDWSLDWTAHADGSRQVTIFMSLLALLVRHHSLF